MMSEAIVRDLCRRHGQYATPQLNEVLYALNAGINSLEGLQSYTGLRSLFLEGNFVTSLASLPHLPSLTCL